MESFNSLYNKAVRAYLGGETAEGFKKSLARGFNAHHLDCLLNPGKYPPVIRLGDCECHDCELEDCNGQCYFGALSRDGKGNAAVAEDQCVGCGECIERCKKGNLAERKDILPVFELLNKKEAPVYAMIAPAFKGQFSSEVTPGKLRSAFKRLGFAGMIEVALFADILTLKEALEFDRSIKSDSDFLLTSCCCPVWIAIIRRVYKLLVPHVPPSVSPMVASGRAIKKLYPGAKTVFIGPCLAKKAEAREEDIRDAVDYVLTFRETQDVFDIAEINPAVLEEDEREHSSRAGRIYGRTGGVSEAVQHTLDRLKPNREIRLRSKQVDGAAACKALLAEIKEGVIDANFIEGMGCPGGCVGGPRVLIDRDQGALHVNEYGKEAAFETPAENPYVIELLHRLGFDTVESLLERDNIFVRDF